MANTDPPHKVDDGEAPAGGDIDAPNTCAPEKQVADGGVQDAEQHGRHAEDHEPENRRMLLQHNATDAVGDSTHIMTGPEQRRSHAYWRYGFELFNLGHEFQAFSNSGFGFRTAAIYVVR